MPIIQFFNFSAICDFYDVDLIAAMFMDIHSPRLVLYEDGGFQRTGIKGFEIGGIGIFEDTRKWFFM